MKFLLGSSVFLMLGLGFLVMEMNHDHGTVKGGDTNTLLDKKSWFKVIDQYNGCDVVMYSAKGDHTGSAYFLDCQSDLYQKYHN